MTTAAAEAAAARTAEEGRLRLLRIAAEEAGDQEAHRAAGEALADLLAQPRERVPGLAGVALAVQVLRAGGRWETVQSGDGAGDPLLGQRLAQRHPAARVVRAGVVMATYI